MGMVWTNQIDEMIRSSLAAGQPTRAVASMLGCSHTAVANRAKKLGITISTHSAARMTPEPKPTERQSPSREAIVNAQRVRRGFDLPKEMEPEYLELLKSGVPIAEARRRLGL